jgi:hypothetical protein
MVMNQSEGLKKSPQRKDFEGGVHLGIGSFNLVSMTPLTATFIEVGVMCLTLSNIQFSQFHQITNIFFIFFSSFHCSPQEFSKFWSTLAFLETKYWQFNNCA